MRMRYIWSTIVGVAASIGVLVAASGQIEDKGVERDWGPRGDGLQVEDRYPPHHPLADVTSIVEATVSRVWNEYDERLGPRIYVALSDVVVHAGTSLPETTFSQLGGPLPNGNFVEVIELPKFSPGARYILFFGREASVYTPVWARLAFRVEQVANRGVVLGPDGNLVRRFDVNGVEFGARHLILAPSESAHFLAPLTFDAKAAAEDPDIAKALTPEAFVHAIKRAAQEVGAPLGEPMSLRPPQDVVWNVSRTSPQQVSREGSEVK